MKTKGIAIVAVLSVIAIGSATGAYYYNSLPHNRVVEIVAPETTSTNIDYDIDVPEKPEDFNLILREMQSQYIDLCALDRRYFLQPEFYSNSWSRGKRYYIDHDYARWGVHGYGAYPGNPTIVFENKSVGNWISLCAFFRTGWNVETWQGIKLVPEDNEYFHINVKPNEFLLGRTFPIFECGEEDSWAKKLKLNLSIRKTPPRGTYKIGINTISPSESNAQKWFWYVMRQNITSDVDLKMIEECEKQLEMSTKCEEWIGSSRKNKYIDSGIFQMPSRLTIKVIVK